GVRRLNRRLALEEAVRTPDGAGGYQTNWVVLGHVWASVTAGSGRERAAETVTVSTVGYRIVVRARPFGAPSRPKPDQRFRSGTRIFRIVSVSETDEDARYLTCLAQEEVL